MNIALIFADSKYRCTVAGVEDVLGALHGTCEVDPWDSVLARVSRQTTATWHAAARFMSVGAMRAASIQTEIADLADWRRTVDDAVTARLGALPLILWYAGLGNHTLTTPRVCESLLRSECRAACNSEEAGE